MYTIEDNRRAPLHLVVYKLLVAECHYWLYWCCSDVIRPV